MPFEKGQSGNPAGRPKGAKDKLTSEARQLFVHVMEGEVQHIEDALDGLRNESSEKYIKALSSLFPYFMPKKVENEVTINEAPTTPSWFGEVIETEGEPAENGLLKKGKE